MTFSALDRLKAQAESAVSDDVFEKRHERWSDNVPDTKEGYYIRDIFDGKPQVSMPISIRPNQGFRSLFVQGCCRDGRPVIFLLY